jgi:antitoxin ParD1/3/4
MSRVQKVSIALTPEMYALVQDAVKSGQYASASEVVRDALRLWANKLQLRQEATSHLRALIQDGLDSGQGREIDFEELKAQMRAERERHADSRRVA